MGEHAQVISAGSPVAFLSVSSITSIGDYNKPDRSCATNPDSLRVTDMGEVLS